MKELRRRYMAIIGLPSLRGTRRQIATELRHWYAVQSEDACFLLARYLPRKLRYWATIMSCAQATTGEYSATVVSDLLMVDMLKRLSDDLQRRERSR